MEYDIKLKYTLHLNITVRLWTKRKKSGFKTKRSANVERGKVIGELYNGTYVVYDNVRLDEFLEYWLEIVMRPKMTDDSYKNYRNIIR